MTLTVPDINSTPEADQIFKSDLATQSDKSVADIEKLRSDLEALQKSFDELKSEVEDGKIVETLEFTGASLRNFIGEADYAVVTAVIKVEHTSTNNIVALLYTGDLAGSSFNLASQLYSPETGTGTAVFSVTGTISRQAIIGGELKVDYGGDHSYSPIKWIVSRYRTQS